MFDSYARSLLIDVPELEGLTGDSAARQLSRAYLSLMQYRTGSSLNADYGTTQDFLRRLANALLFQVVLDSARETAQRRAAAFVAAEAIGLLADFMALGSTEDRTHAYLAERFARIESALLYLFAAYDACAAGVLTIPTPIASNNERVDESAAVWCLDKLETLCRLDVNAASMSGMPVTFQAADSLTPEPLEQDTIGRLYVEVGLAAAEFAGWLGANDTGMEHAVARLDALLTALTPTVAFEGEFRTGHHYSRVYHLATLLRLCFPAMGERSLRHSVPSPSGVTQGSYAEYLTTRAIGSDKAAPRPLLWPSAVRYIQECLIGNAMHGVVSMPTGSGKSFVAELAASQAVHSGWVLYLAPTNALAEQIRGDLRIGLASLSTQIFAFIGDQEYSVFSADTVAQMPSNSVAVMTPEKCALALRLSPEAFANCSLVIFDECHLIGDAGSARGPVAELVIAQLMLRAPACRFLLMSAIVQNPDELAGWLNAATGGNSIAVSILWRPTRTLRAVLGVLDESFQAAANQAQASLSTLPDHRKKLSFTAECALAACLQGAWQSESDADYGIASIRCDADLSVSRKKIGAQWKYKFNADSWVNSTARNLASVLCDHGIQTLVFTPASKHYPFSNATKTTLADSTLANLAAPPSLTTCLKTLAEYELGCVSVVFELLGRGIAVHTSLMLEVEKIASELLFKNRCSPLMFATGTLAQGLNLPAIAVIIAGTRIGDPRGEDAEIVQQRKFSQLLNAAGRAGRAGFANQGTVITIPDHPIAFKDFANVLIVRRQADFLQKADNAIAVGSGLDQFLDNVCAEVLRPDQASDLELQVVALLAGGDEQQLDPESVLRRTYAAYRRQQTQASQLNAGNVQHLIQVRDTFIEDANAPEWLTIAAQRAGLDFFATLAIFSAWQKVRDELPNSSGEWNVMQWLEEFLTVAAMIPPGLLDRHLPKGQLKRVSSAFTDLVEQRPALFLERSHDWIAPPEWLQAWSTIRPPLEAWMQGAPLTEIAALLVSRPVDDIPPDRTAGAQPIPRALNVTGDTWSSLALLAGGFLAVAEQQLHGQVPLALASLPLCIKYGCDSPGTLAWFRFGVRLRRASRLLASRFPPPDLATDEELRLWVRNQRADFLSTESFDNHATTADFTVVKATKEFITA